MASNRIRRMNHTGFTVSDLGRACGFFRDVLGFTIGPVTRHNSPVVGRMVGVPGAVVDIAFATLADSTVELICYVEPRSNRANDLQHCDTGFAHIAFEVDDIESTMNSVRSAGYRLFSEPQVIPAGPRKGGKNVYTQGPDGIVVELQQAAPAVSTHSPRQD